MNKYYRLISLKDDNSTTLVASCQQLTISIEFHTGNDIGCE
jgi:hypothetical protein